MLTGATGGLGRRIAHHLDQRGASLVLSGRSQPALSELATELGDRAVTVAADLAQKNDLERLAREAGNVDVLVANAGLPASGRLLSFEIPQIDRALEVNLRSAIVLTRLLLPAMLQRRRGHVVLMSSMTGKVPRASASIYNATKFGLRGFGLALRQELHGSGVGVSIVCPTFVSEAGMWAETGARAHPLAGQVSPDQVARAVLRAVEHDVTEIDVAPLPTRIGGRLAGAFPGLMTSVMRRTGSSSKPTGAVQGQIRKR